MTQRSLRSAAARLYVAVLALLLLVTSQIAFATPRTRGISVTEERIALIIGNAAYRKIDPLDNAVNDARLLAQTIQKAGFKVTLHENLGRDGLVNALHEFSTRLGEKTIAVVYYAGHGLQLRDRNYLIPVDAEIRSEDEIPITGVDISFILGRMSHARSRINIVVLDACRNNPFAGRTGPAARGLAQMDAPVGTLLAFATAPGKLAADNDGGAHSLYATHLAKNLLTPGLPVELMFKRVRASVVRDSKQTQVPWESSSLQGEFAFVPGVAQASEINTEQEAAGELAFWNSIQNSTRADEYRAYLRQYPQGKFVALAQMRIAAFTASSSAAPGATVRPEPQTAGSRADALPRVGDTWRYRVQDQFRMGDLFMTAKVEQVGADGISETWTTTSDAKVRTVFVPLAPGFHALPGWNLTPPEFSPYLQASGLLRSGQKIGDQQRRFEKIDLQLSVSIEGEEELVVSAGKFRATKLVLRGKAQPRGAPRANPVSAEHVVWYAPDVKRVIRYTVATRVGTALQEATVFELMEYRLN